MPSSVPWQEAALAQTGTFFCREDSPIPNTCEMLSRLVVTLLLVPEGNLAAPPLCPRVVPPSDSRTQQVLVVLLPQARC